MPRYTFNPDRAERYKAINAQRAGDLIEGLRKKGKARPVDIVEAGRPKSSPIHTAFTWDDKAAADKCRKQEARMLVTSLVCVVVSPSGTSVTTRAFPSVDSGQGREYVGVASVMRDPAMKAQLVANALSDLTSFQKKYQAIREIAGDVEALKSKLERIAPALQPV